MNQKSKLPTLESLPLFAALLAPVAFSQDELDEKGVDRADHAKVSNLLGADIKNHADENLGDIQDLVFNIDGKISTPDYSSPAGRR